MKLKIKITGPKVHEVGYRVFLGKLAMALALPGFTAYNWEEDGHQAVIALVEGDPSRIAAFHRQVEGRRPELARVESIKTEEYDGEVGRTTDFAMVLSFEQLDKAIPILSKIEKNTDLIPQVAVNTGAILKDTSAILKDTGAILKDTGAILDEVRWLREDIQPGFAMQFRQVQVDVRAIKERLGIS